MFYYGVTCVSSLRPYSGFAGRDASRGLATFSVEPVSISDCFGPTVITINTDLWQVSDEYDDLSDLKPSEMEQVKEWELQFRFLKKSDPCTVYSKPQITPLRIELTKRLLQLESLL